MIATELRWGYPRYWTDDTARVTCWPSDCGRYRVVRRRSLFVRNAKGKPAVRYYAMALECGFGSPFWDYVDPHRRRRWYGSRKLAEAACQRDSNSN